MQKQKIEEEDELEIIKAVAQAWHGHSNSSTKAASDSEFDAHRLNFKSKPTRFKFEDSKNGSAGTVSSRWDFRQSLWDSYEILAVSKKLERGSVSDYLFYANNESRRRKESQNSLRKLFAMDT